MRIRKNAKLSSQIYPQGSRPESVHVCQLNQSPWDVIPFAQEPYPSSLHHQFDAEDSFNGNGSLGDSIGAVESVASMMESEEKAIMKVEGMVIDDNDDNDEMKIGRQFGFKSQCEEEEEEEKEEKQEALLKSCNNNNNHSSDSGNNPSSLTSKKAEKNGQVTGSRRGRARAAKKGSSSASNPYEFYYYSGFGPLWGKRRGGSDRAGEISKDIEAKEVENNSSAITTQNNTTPSSSSQIDNDEEFDYVDDEDDEDDENGDSGKKRMRKPVKARSLKSLM
ncbi:major centromere autoantigen B [Herrania umbratica]|uniref:Major centromere autoantigen B n=1 Tax=Herrania umbratica TaxID=108875 RepID=A0A6J0ZZ11_9ROSI|nr:major centromere autoantigen B [Herrania umbratica]